MFPDHSFLIAQKVQPVRIDQHCCCVDRTELVLGCGIPEVLSMLLMSRVKSGTNSRSGALIARGLLVIPDPYTQWKWTGLEILLVMLFDISNHLSD
jgi:hypothetical protein